MPTRTSKTSTSGGQKEAAGAKVKRMTGNGVQSAGLCCFKMKENTQIAMLESQVVARQKKFGVDYLTLMDKGAPESHLKKCIKDAVNDIQKMREDIDDHHDNIDDKAAEVQQKIKLAPGAAMESAPPPSPRSGRRSKASLSSSTNDGDRSPRPLKKSGSNSSSGRNIKNGNRSPRSSKKMAPGALAASGSSPSFKNGKNGTNNKKSGYTTPDRSPKNSPKNSPGKYVVGRSAPKKPPSTSNGGNKSASNGANKSKRNSSTSLAAADVPEEYKDADLSKWKSRTYNFSGAAKFEEKGKEEKVKGSLAKGLKKFKANPGKYTAMAYQSDMKDWPENQQQYILLHRKGTIKWQPQGVSPKGWMTVHVNEYERLIPFKDDILPKKFRDKHTDNMTFNGKKLHSAQRKPIMPGRGMGIGDSPGLKIIGDVDPSDIYQGSVGDCWLLSGISAVAEFDGAIKKLFRKTPNLFNMPMDNKDGTVATGNMYTVTLWDLTTWKEVDIVIDERLPAHYNGTGDLLAGKPSDDGELWACYLEKALAVHCGGWDKLVGGQCTHAWALLTGCREQYTMRRNPATGKWRCFAKCNPKTKEWATLANSPKDCSKTTWRVDWPEVGGGGSRDVELDDEEMFMRLFAWDQVNYIVAAGTPGTSDKNSTGGMVDNHAYSVIESVDNVAGTDIDLIRVRNPWGNGEIEDGEFDDDGPGWDKYPQIKKELNPVVADDGMFWVTKKEFFKLFETIYLSASNMTEFLED